MSSFQQWLFPKPTAFSSSSTRSKMRSTPTSSYSPVCTSQETIKNGRTILESRVSDKNSHIITTLGSGKMTFPQGHTDKMCTTSYGLFSYNCEFPFFFLSAPQPIKQKTRSKKQQNKTKENKKRELRRFPH